MGKQLRQIKKDRKSTPEDMPKAPDGSMKF